MIEQWFYTFFGNELGGFMLFLSLVVFTLAVILIFAHTAMRLGERK